MNLSRLLLAAVAVAVLGGCGAPASDVPLPASTPPPTASFQSASSTPTSVDVPAIAATSTLVPLDLNPDRTLQVPPVTEPGQAGWFVRSGRDGMPLVVAAHNSGRLDGVQVPGLFARLGDVKPGDTVTVGYGTDTVMFTVYRVGSFDKDQFPTAAVYGDVSGRELRLITCGGPFVGGEQVFGDNVVVFASVEDAR